MTYKVGKMHYLDYIDEHGKRHREPWSTSAEAAENEEKRRKYLVALLGGDASQFGQILWSDFKFLLDQNRYPNQKPGTTVQDKAFIKWVDEYIKPEKLIDVTPAKVENMRALLARKDKVGKQSLERKIRAGFAIFTWAFEQGLLHEPIAWHAVKNTHIKRKRPRFLTMEQYKHVLSAWNPMNKNPIKHSKQLYTYALMGRRMMLRPSEIWFAKWDLLDIENREYRLQNGEVVEFDVKAESYRTIPFGPMLAAYFTELKKTAKGKYIIDWDGKRIMQGTRFFRHISTALTDLGYPKATAYSFRHTGATHMVVKNKESLTTAGKIMGHTSSTTTEIYIDPVTEDMRVAAEHLEQMEYCNDNLTCCKDCVFCLKKDLIIKAVLAVNNLTNKKDHSN